MPSAPLAEVKKNFESRSKLAEQLAGMVDRQDGDSDQSVKARLMGLSNQRLLRLYAAEQKVRERFGSREKLVAHLVSERNAAALTADDSFSQKLTGYSKARLLDLARQRHAPPTAKQTPEDKLKKKRGRKARERALSKIKG